MENVKMKLASDLQKLNVVSYEEKGMCHEATSFPFIVTKHLKPETKKIIQSN